MRFASVIFISLLLLTFSAHGTVKARWHVGYQGHGRTFGDHHRRGTFKEDISFPRTVVHSIQSGQMGELADADDRVKNSIISVNDTGLLWKRTPKSVIDQDILKVQNVTNETNITNVDSVQVHLWNFTASHKHYCQAIRDDYIYNDMFNDTYSGIPYSLAQRLIEVKINEIAEIAFQSYIAESNNSAPGIQHNNIGTSFLGFISNEWEELKQNLVLQFSSNASLIVYNEMRGIWIFCSWVPNWYSASTTALKYLLALAPPKLRVCCAHELLDEKITRSPIVLLDYIPLNYTKQLVASKLNYTTFDNTFHNMSRFVNTLSGHSNNFPKRRGYDRHQQLTRTSENPNNDTIVIDLFDVDKTYIDNCKFRIFKLHPQLRNLRQND